HYDVTVKSKILHCDISSGNILILPTFVLQQEGDMTLRVTWRGILADWELSKPISRGEEVNQALRPKRTGTWRYMSVASLMDALHIVQTADEIESFFNVLLYNVIR
ncbi:hypothetical protein DICSQDRAFT_22180, partial [Dichomitus squalens LYAD-421 SS1]